MKYPEYDSPISLTFVENACRQIAERVDEQVWASIEMAVDVDKDKLIRILQQDSERYREAYKRGYETGYARAKEEMAEALENECEEDVDED